MICSEYSEILRLFSKVLFAPSPKFDYILIKVCLRLSFVFFSSLRAPAGRAVPGHQSGRGLGRVVEAAARGEERHHPGLLRAVLPQGALLR